MKRTTSSGPVSVCRCDPPAGRGEACPRRLPQVRIQGRLYFQDDRLQEYRAVDNPCERISFEVMAWAVAILGKWPD
jgi:hypothetical protein